MRAGTNERKMMKHTIVLQSSSSSHHRTGAGILIALLAVVGFVVDLSPHLFAQEKPSKAPVKSRINEVIVVTATRSDKKLEETPGGTAVIDRGDIMSRDVGSIDQAINTIPGVFNRRGKGLMDTQSAITLRGFPSQQRTLIMLDGIPLNDSYLGAVQFGGLATRNVERIEVVKGPFSSLYGGNAMGGVVNIVTRMPENRELIMSGGFGTGLQNRQAMNDLTRGYFSYGETFKSKFGILISYGQNRTNGFANDLNIQTTQPPSAITGYRETTDTQGNRRYVLGDRGDNTWRDHDFSFKTTYRISYSSHLGFSFVTSAYRYGTDLPHSYLHDSSGNPVYGFTSGKNTVGETAFLSGAGNRRQDIYSLSFDTMIGRAQMKSMVSFLNINNNWYTTPGSTAATTINGGPGTIAETPVNKTTGSIQFLVPISSHHILTFGGDLTGSSARTQEYGLTNWRDENSRSFMTYSAGGKSIASGIFLQEEVAIRKNVTAYVGLRGDYWRTFDGYANQVGTAGFPASYEKRNAFSISPKASIVYRLSPATTLRSSIGRVFRPPTVYELYRTWSYSSGTVYRGNPDLKPETALSWDASIDRSLWKGSRASIAYFENRMSDLVYRRTDPANSKINDYVNAGKARGRGVEMELSQRLMPEIRLFANTTFNSAKISENATKPSTEGKFLTYLPRWTGNGGAEFEKGRIKATMIGRYVAKLYTQDENKDVVNNVPGSFDPYFIADAKVIYRINRLLAFSLSMDNIFDRKYFYSYLAPRRSVFAEIFVTWKE
jgi:iron complex outermembrane recepter protein